MSQRLSTASSVCGRSKPRKKVGVSFNKRKQNPIRKKTPPALQSAWKAWTRHNFLFYYYFCSFKHKNLPTSSVEWQWVITQTGHLQELLVSDFSHLHCHVCSQITISWSLLFSRKEKDMKGQQYKRCLENNLLPQNRKRRCKKKKKKI